MTELNHTLLAADSNSGEPPVIELLPSLIAGFYPLGTLLRDLETLGAVLAAYYDVKGPTIETQIEILQRSARGLQNDEELLGKLRAGEYTALTDENQIANLALYAVANRNFNGLARTGSFARMLALFNYAELRNPDTGRLYVDPDSVQGTFSVATLYRERANNLAYRYKRFVEWSDTTVQGHNPVDVRESFFAAK